MADSLSGPGELYDMTASGAPRALTAFGKAMAEASPLAPAEQFSFTGWNGGKVYGYVVKPQDYTPGMATPWS